MTTGDATNSPSAKANLSVMKNGSVGLVNMSRPPGTSGAIGALRSPITSTRWTTNQPTSVPTTMASRLYRMRQRSSSRWSRNGISPREAGSGTGPPEREGARDAQRPRRCSLSRARLAPPHGVPGRTDRRPRGARVQRGHRLLGPLLDSGPELREALLALARQLLHRNELLLHADQVRADVAAELHQIGLLRRDRLLHGG